MRAQFVIVATIALNAVLFLFNLVVALASRSAAVLSQAIYSVTDLIGALLLLWGFYASQRPPDYEHPFGYGKERFFWAFSASLITFSVAGLIALQAGITQIGDPRPVTHLGDALIVVGATLLVSILGIYVTIRELRRAGETLMSLLESTQTGLKTVFFQDLVSIFGSVVAFFGIVVVYRTHVYMVDGIAAAGVGLLLVATGVVLAAESRPLLVGKAISPMDARSILTEVERDARVRKVRGLQTMMLGPEDVLVALKVNFQDGLTTDQIESVIDQIAVALRQSHPSVRHLVIEPEA